MLGAVQGVAEVYPVSSSAQVTLLPRLLGWDPPDDRTRFAAGLHAGSAVGVALALRHDLRALRAPDVRRMAAASVPASMAGLLLHDLVERRLGTTRGIATGLAIGGLALLWADARGDTSRPPGNLLPNLPQEAAGTRNVEAHCDRGVGPSWSTHLAAAALAQTAALAPGVSRHGAVLTALRARGVERAAAARSSLLLSLPVTLGAAGLTAVRGRALPPLLPTLVAGATAYAATRRARWSATATRTAAGIRLGLAAAALVHDRRRKR